MIVKVALAVVGLVLSMLGFVLAAEEGDFASEYEVFRRMMTSEGRVADANAVAAASMVSRGEKLPSPQALRREIVMLERVIAMSAKPPTPPLEARITGSARKLAAQVPTSGYAWCALSSAAVRQRWEPTAMERVLHRCGDAFPYEDGSIAERLRQSVLLWPLLSQMSRERALADLDKLLRSHAHGVRMAEAMARFVATTAPERGADFARVVAANDTKIRAVYGVTLENIAKQAGGLSGR